MLLTNHTLTGVVLGITLSNPYLIAPASVISHLLLDMTPHFGPGEKWGWRDRRFIILGGTDFTCSVVVALAAILWWPSAAIPILVGVIGAALPDLTYIPLILFGQHRVIRWLPWYKPMLAFLGRIQWYERPPGLITEAMWATGMIITLLKLIEPS